jgi:hypothetical protein
MKMRTTVVFAGIILANMFSNYSMAEEITACIHKKTGALRVAGKCKIAESLMVLNTVGPKGDTGPQGTQGTKGDTGPQGPKGNPGTSGTGGGVKVFDANNQFLGYWLGMKKDGGIGTGSGLYRRPTDSYSILVPSANAVLEIDELRGSIVHSSAEAPESVGKTYPSYSAKDCTGTKYYSPQFSYPTITKAGDGKLYSFKNHDLVLLSAAYGFNVDGSVCIDNGEQQLVATNYDFSEVVLPFTLPLSVPIRLEAP